jgi:hypothetical protein
MDWRQIDLTLEGHIGGIDHPDMPWELRRKHSEGDLYTHIFREYRIDGMGVLQIVDDHEIGREPFFPERDESHEEAEAANAFMHFFQRFPAWAKAKWGWLNGAIAGGDCCDRCMVQMNLLNSSQPGCCDACEAEMGEQMAANPDVVWAFERGGLRAVA